MNGIPYPRPTRTNGEVRWAWFYGAVLGATVVWFGRRTLDR
jgi:hypothetical protein